MAAFEAPEHGAAARGGDAAHVGGGAGELDALVLRDLLHERPVHRAGALRGLRALAVARRDIRGEEGSVEAALDHAGEVDVATAAAALITAREVVAVVEHQRRRVDVAVEDKRVVV